MKKSIIITLLSKSIIITLLSVCCICNTAVADRIEREDIAIGFRGGLNISSSQGSYNNTLANELSQRGINTRFDKEFGGHFGVITDIGITKWFYIQPGVYFTTKSFDFYLSNTDNPNYDWRRLYELYYLEIPVLASFRIELADDFMLQLNAGAFVACGVGGNVKDNIIKDELINIGDFLGNPFVKGEGGLHRFDAGLQFGIGFTYNEFFIGAAYDWGLFDITTHAMGYSGSIKTGNIMVSVGYTLSLD